MKLTNQTIIIFGGTGSLGKTLISRLYKKNKLIVYSRDEAKHWTIKNELKNQKNIKFVIGDIRDQERVDKVFLEFNPSIAIIASAKRSSSSLVSDSVGSTIKVPTTGHDMVGAWKP